VIGHQRLARAVRDRLPSARARGNTVLYFQRR
jgi:hypothetical protein